MSKLVFTDKVVEHQTRTRTEHTLSFIASSYRIADILRKDLIFVLPWRNKNKDLLIIIIKKTDQILVIKACVRKCDTP